MKKSNNIKVTFKYRKIFDSVGRIAICLLFFVAILLFSLVDWTTRTFGELNMNKILFNLSEPIQGVAGGYIKSAIVNCLVPSVLLTTITVFILFFPKDSKRKKIKAIPYRRIIVLILSVAIIFVSVVLTDTRFGLFEFIVSQRTNSPFIKQSYVPVLSKNVMFPHRKRNLIYIFLESIESTFSDKENGGAFDDNYIPNLTALADENINFSNTSKLGGALPAFGTTWTIAGMFAHTAGLHLNLPISENGMSKYTSFFPGITALGDILEDEGYRNVLFIGSDAVFGGRENYFKNHGNYEICDYKWAIENRLIPQNYRVWWGFEDAKLFKFAKDKLLELAESEQPFNFTMLTVDTHFEDGYVSRGDYRDLFGNQYANVIATSDRQLRAFLDWLEQQDFYQDTTIVISGDHLTMDSDFCEGLDEDYQRTVYNCFINSAVTADDNAMKNRIFTSMDLFPTTLAAMGVMINGNRLGLGTNLFSGIATIPEIVGIEFMNDNLRLKSNYYIYSLMQLEEDEKS